MKALSIALLAGAGLALSQMGQACIWDSDTLAQEKSKSPKLAEAILGKAPDLGDATKLRGRIADLKANKRESDPLWWNDLAGAHIRLGEPQQAVALLEANLTRFPNDYGIHANLGTAYHLLGRYEEAEKEIARDLEINANAHFGLEKYHLALLQYLTRDSKYKSRHVYVDEFSLCLVQAFGPHLYSTDEGLTTKSAKKDYAGGLAEAEQVLANVSKRSGRDSEYAKQEVLAAVVCLDPKPAYRTKWNLASDPKLNEGVIYMASLNPKEPACFAMLGVVCWRNGDLNLAAAAFEKAIKLGSPMSPSLKQRTRDLKSHIRESQRIHGRSQEESPKKQPKR